MARITRMTAGGTPHKIGSDPRNPRSRFLKCARNSRAGTRCSEQESLLLGGRFRLIVGAEHAHLARTEPDALADGQLQCLVPLARQLDLDDLAAVLQFDAHYRADRMHMGDRCRQCAIDRLLGKTRVRTRDLGGTATTSVLTDKLISLL